MPIDETKEPQYGRQVELRETIGLSQLGLTTNQLWHDDPRHLLFVLARYKFVSKMLSGKKRVLEVGCGDAFGTRIVLQEVESITAIDFDPVFIADVQSRMQDRWKFECRTHDLLQGPVPGDFDAIYSLDVIEHIAAESELTFVGNAVKSLVGGGVMIVGTPSIQSQVYASPPSKAGHINCKDATSLKELMARFFENVFIFCMNDEVMHSGFAPMGHYLFALCAGKSDRF